MQPKPKPISKPPEIRESLLQKDYEFLLEKYNKLLIGSDKDQISPLQVFACLKCGHVNDYFLPNGSQKQS